MLSLKFHCHCKLNLETKLLFFIYKITEQTCNHTFSSFSSLPLFVHYIYTADSTVYHHHRGRS